MYLYNVLTIYVIYALTLNYSKTTTKNYCLFVAQINYDLIYISCQSSELLFHVIYVQSFLQEKINV